MALSGANGRANGVGVRVVGGGGVAVGVTNGVARAEGPEGPEAVEKIIELAVGRLLEILKERDYGAYIRLLGESQQ
jgi:hypothetical protein